MTQGDYADCGGGGHNICSVVLTCCRGFPGALMPSRGWSQYLIIH